jgi:oxygen-independent coproporphyrinogen-3 oxidase
MKANQSSRNEPMGLYVHVPFCRSKCGYCAFYSVEPARGQVEAYLLAIEAEMKLVGRDPRVRNRRFATVYIGGGTPSTLAPEALAALLRQAFDHFEFLAQPEVTVEANPESAGCEFAAMAAGTPGCRVSLGAQSFCGDVLGVLGRIHSPEAVRRSFRILRDAGVQRINLDLIYGTPGETMQLWMKSLDETLDLNPDHISAYCLSIEDGTRLAELVESGSLQPPDEALQSDMYVAARERLEDGGFENYEISNFAKPAARSLHNQIYWRRGEYIGLGAAAHSFVDGVRRCNHYDVERYCRALSERGDPTAWRENVSQGQAVEETIMLALRTSDGIDLDALESAWGSDARADIVDRAAPLVLEGLTAISGSRLRITPRGYFVSDEIIARLLPETRRAERNHPS